MQLRLHKLVIEVIVNALKEVIDEQNHIKFVLIKTLKEHKKFGSRDRRLVADTLIELVRMFRYYQYISGPNPSDYQGIVYVYFQQNFEEMPQWLTQSIDTHEVEKRKAEALCIRKIRESYPDWMDELMVKELGQEVWERESKEMNKKSNPALRVNTIKCTKQRLINEFGNENIEIELFPEIESAIGLTKRRDLLNLTSFQKGYFEIQDAGSQLIAPFLAPTEGSLVIDACAGAGGKSLHLAALMNNRGHILSLDVHKKKLEELHKRRKRTGARIIVTEVINEETLIKHQKSADFLLLDVPCSGLGVLKRNPDDKWKMTPTRLEELKKIQQEILSSYTQMLTDTGVLVYATCSLLPCENSEQIQTFLANHPQFKLEKEVQVLPSAGTDGFYMARLINSPTK